MEEDGKDSGQVNVSQSEKSSSNFARSLIKGSRKCNGRPGVGQRKEGKKRRKKEMMTDGFYSPFGGNGLRVTLRTQLSLIVPKTFSFPTFVFCGTDQTRDTRVGLFLFTLYESSISPRKNTDFSNAQESFG